METRASVSGEAYGQVLAARFSFDGAGTLSGSAENPDLQGEGVALGELSAYTGDFSTVLALKGRVARGSAFEAGETLEGGFEASLQLALDNERLSGSLKPRFELSTGLAASTGWGVLLSLGFGIGQFVVKPSLDLSFVEWADGTESLGLMPKLDVSWYPGLPLALETGLGYRRSVFTDASVSDELPFALAFSAGLSKAVFLSAKASGLYGLADSLFHSAKAEAGISVVILSGKTTELALPLALSWNLATPEALAWKLALEYSF